MGHGESIGPDDIGKFLENTVSSISKYDNSALYPKTIGVTDEMMNNSIIPTAKDFLIRLFPINEMQ
jgi:hypothetical protein